MKRSPITPYLFLLPGSIILGAFIFYPMLNAIWLSFTDYNMVTESSFIGFENYKELFADKLFWKVLGQTFLYLIVVVPILVILPIFLAILVNQQVKGISFFRSAYYVPVVTSMVVVGIMWKWVYADTGILNYFLQSIGIIDEPVHWLTSTSTSIFAVMAVTIWKGLGYYMVIYLAGLQSIPSDLYEAADIDGASKWKQIIHITIPLLMPSILIVSIMSSISAMKVFEEIYVMTGGGPLNSSKTLVFYIYQEAFEKLKMGYASAAGVVLFLITLVLSIINIKMMGKKEEAIKG
ncbi:carbohydrate ABC transporter membrane protein 1 (CUT1 family) [Cytobacillus oceanisediminis]|uniref:Carbohydrate ABC transporter membrane protein 1 (CUT1 family) n=1 Tax=Cytobacillus oceanisediminis TaxID=665099 RepID=A0A2V3A3L8_9BACI|nr:sugar ABC transporter permease [Cytobacillus oceanisediminis]PWW31311.1 carbohydrate ABC transporter membrane protein 1 (CUT1 family) [Cytobacillus oceanisediminis]